MSEAGAVGRVLTFTLRRNLPTTNELLRIHPLAHGKKKAALAWEIAAQIIGQIPPVPFARARVTVERRSLGECDEDNLWGGVKWLLDVLQPPAVIGKTVRHKSGLSVIAEDNPTCLTTEIRPVRVDRRADQGTTVVVEELPPCPCPDAAGRIAPASDNPNNTP